MLDMFHFSMPMVIAQQNLPVATRVSRSFSASVKGPLNINRSK